METGEKQFKVVLLRTFKAFIDFCEEYELTYYAAYGTLLGAVRHDGIIPWDDDIDVFMPRADYMRFLSLRGQTGDNYEIIDIDTKGYFLDFAKFSDKKTSLMEKPGEPVIGIYIDIFPLDNYDDEKCRALVKYNQLYYYAWMIYGHSQRRYSWAQVKYFLKCKQYYYLAVMVFDICFAKCLAWPARQIINVFVSKLKSVPSTDKLWKYSILRSKSFVRHGSWFGKGKKHRFEHLQVTVPDNYDAILMQDYGDYMTPPPKEQQESIHYHFFVDYNRRFTEREVFEHLIKSL